jgi:hypothetical protein
MAGSRNLQVDIDGDPSGFDRACDSAEQSARKFDRELERLERAQRSQEQSATSAARSTRDFARSNSEAEIASRKAGLAAKEAGERAQKAQDQAARAAERASIAQRNAADAANAQFRGEITAAEAAQAQSRALGEVARSEGLATVAARQLERADIAQALAARAAGKAADELADQQREAGRAALLTAGVQRLTALRASGAVREHNALLARMRREYTGLGNDVQEMSNRSGRAWRLFERAGTMATGLVTKGMTKLSEMGPLTLAAIALGIASLPILAVAAGGAITLGLGGALAAVAIMAASKNAQVQRSFSELKKHVTSELTEMSKPFVPVLTHIATTFTKTFDSLAPALSGAFKTMAPAIQYFVDQFATGLGRMGPTIAKVADEFAPLLGTLGTQMPTIMANLSHGIDGFVSAVSGHEGDFAGFIVALSDIVKYAGYAAKALGAVYDTVVGAKVLGNAWDSVGKLVGGSAKGFSEASQASWDAQTSTTALGTSVLRAGDAMTTAAYSASTLKANLDSLSGKALSARDAEIQYGNAILAMNKSLHENGKSHGFATEKGLANEAQLQNLIKTSQDYAVKMRDAGADTLELGKFIDGARAKIVLAATKMGYTGKEAQKLATKLLGVTAAAKTIPTKTQTQLKGTITDLQSKIEAAKARLKTVPASKRTAIEATIADLQRKVAAARAALASLRNRTVVVTTVQYGVSAGAQHGPGRLAKGGYTGYATGGEVQGFPTGGLFRGAGTTTSDSNIIAVSDKEFIVNARATAQHRGLLEAINSGATGGASHPVPSVPHMASGGGAATLVLQINSGGARMDALIVEIIRKSVDVKGGGNVQVAFGRNR